MDNDQTTIIAVNAAILFVCLVVGVVSCIYVLNSSKRKGYQASGALLLVLFIFLPLQNLNQSSSVIIDQLKQFVDYPKVVNKAFKEYTPNCTLLATNCPFCEIEQQAAVDITDTYQISDVNTYDDYTNQIDPYVTGFGLGVSAVSILVIILSQKWFESLPCVNVINRTWSFITGFLLSLLGVSFVAFYMTFDYLCRKHINKENLDADVQWFVDTSVDNKDGVRPWIDNIEDFKERCSDITPAVIKVTSPGALEDEYDKTYEEVCNQIPLNFLGVGIVMLVSVLLWEAILIASSVRSNNIAKSIGTKIETTYKPNLLIF